MESWLKTTTIGLVAAVALTAAPLHADAAEYLIKFGHNQRVKSPHHTAILHFKELVEKRAKEAGFDAEVQVFPAMQLGGMAETTEQVKAGAVQMTQQPTAVLANWAGAMNVVGFPFLFPDGDTAFKVLNGPAGANIMKALEPEGLVGFSFWPLGAIYVTSNRETRTVDDLKGQKIRVIPSPILIATYEAWGAIPTPIGFGELYTALQQGVVDGEENPLQTAVMLNFWEVQKYFVNTRHSFFNYGVVANKKWWEGLPAGLRAIITKAEDDAVHYHKKLLDAAIADWHQTVAKNGGTFVEPTGPALEKWKMVSKPVHEQFVGSGEGKVAPDVYKAILDAIDKASM